MPDSCDHDHHPQLDPINVVDRRGFLKKTAFAAAAGGVALASPAAAQSDDPYADPPKPALPPTDVEVTLANTALVVTDPQIDFLSPDGVTWFEEGRRRRQRRAPRHGRQYRPAAGGGQGQGHDSGDLAAAGMEGPDQRNRHTGQRQHQSTCSSHGNRCLNSTNQAADITAMRDSHPL